MENLTQDISRIINEITAMQEAYPVAFGLLFLFYFGVFPLV